MKHSILTHWDIAQPAGFSTFVVCVLYYVQKVVQHRLTNADSFMNYSLSDAVLYRVKKTWEYLEKADDRAHEGDLNAAINFLYEACFVMVQALLIKEQLAIDIADHDAVKTTFNNNFIATRKVDQEVEGIYAKLYITRREIIEDEIEFMDTKKIAEYIRRTQRFVTVIGKLLKND